MKLKFVLSISVLLLSSVALAAGDGVPMGTVISQLANLSLLVGGLFFATRKQISQAFADKKAAFLESVNAASKSKQEAEQKLAEVSKRLDDMKASFNSQIEEAKKNAEESYRVQVSDARNAAEKVKSMAQTSLEFEVQKQIENLRVETFQKSAEAAEKKLESSMTPEQLKVWNTRFKSEGVQ
jgi:F-type H+-transporting ATPase subunit b